MTSAPSKPAPRAGSPPCSSPRCPCRAATTPAGSSPASPATTASSSTTSPRRCWSVSPRRSAASCSTPRSSTGSPARCATPSPADSGGRAMLERLDRANLFLVPLDDRRLWYRYHHLFADVLRLAAGRRAAHRVDELHRRAAAWYESSGDQPAAIGHALAGARRRAGGPAHRAGGAGHVPDPPGAHGAPLAHSPCPRRCSPDRPVLSILLVGGAHGQRRDHRRRAAAGRRRAVARPRRSTHRRPIVFDDAALRPAPAQVAVYRAALALIAGDPEATIRHASRALDLAAAIGPPPAGQRRRARRARPLDPRRARTGETPLHARR